MTDHLYSQDQEISTSQGREPRSGRRPTGLATKTKILDAARKIIIEKGTDDLTIDAVIKEAGIGKSTFLHHYPSRSALIDALADEYAKHLFLVETKLSQMTGKGCPMLDGYAEWYRMFTTGETDPGSAPLFPLLLASRENRRHITALRLWYRRVFERAKHQQCGPGRALIHSLVIDCLYFHHIFGIDVLTPEEEKAVLDALRAFVYEEIGHPSVRPKATDKSA